MARYNYYDEGEGYDPRKDNPTNALGHVMGRKMSKTAAYLKSQGASSKPAAKPQPAKKEIKTLEAGVYDIEYVSLTSGRSGFYWVVKLIDGRKIEITDEPLAKQLPEKGGKVVVGADGSVSEYVEQPVEEPAAEPVEEQVAEQPAEEEQQVEMAGSPKQVAWAKKIIEYKTKGAKTAGINPAEWDAAVKYISEHYGARGWIDMRDDHPASILHTAPRATKPAEPAPAKPVASTADMVAKAVEQGIDPEVARKAGQLQDAIAKIASPEDKKRIQTLVIPLIRDAAAAAKSGNVKQAHNLLDMAGETLQEITPDFRVAPAETPSQQAQGITPEVIQKASELQDTLSRAVQGLPPEEARRIKQQINPLAKDAAQLARLGDTKGALRLLDQAIEDVKTYAPPSPPTRPGITPEVMSKASELQDALNTLTKDMPPEEAQRIKRLINPIARDASQLAQAGDTQGAIRLLDQALEDVQSYAPTVFVTTDAPAPQVQAPLYRDDAEEPYDPRRDNPARGVEQAIGRKMSRSVEYLRKQGAVSKPAPQPSPEVKDIKTLEAGVYDIDYVSSFGGRSGIVYTVKLTDGRKIEITDDRLARLLPERGGKVAVTADGNVTEYVEQSKTAAEVEQAVQQGIDPEVARRAGALQEAIAAVTTPEAKQSIKTLVMPLARDAAIAAKSGDTKQALLLLDQASDTLNDIIAAAPKLPSAPALAQMPPKEAAEKIITVTTEEIMAAIEAAVDATLGGRWGSPSPAQQAIRSQVIADYRALLEKGGSYVADSRGRSVFIPWLRDAEKEMGARLAEIIDKARSIDEVEEGIRALVTRTDQWAEMVARTETLSVANEANRRMYAAEGVEQVQIIAGKDERTCPICKKHHMKVYPIDKAPHLPLHPNCRCVYVPYISEGS